MSRFDRYWEMKTNNPLATGGVEEMFKCTRCGSESFPHEGFDGEPNPHLCSRDCRMEHGDVKTVASLDFRKNFDRVFPNAPGAGL